MPAIPDYITGAREKATTAAEQAGQLAAASPNMEAELKKILNEAIGYNQDILGARGQALGEYLAAPAVARARFGSQNLPTGEANPNYILNPYEQNKAISDYIKTEEIPFLTTNAILGFRQQGEKELISEGIRRFQAQQAAAETAATIARQLYSDLLNEFQTTENIRLREKEIAKTGAGTATERMANEKRQLIKEAAKLPAERRRDYILANGYNPDDPDFSGLFQEPVGFEPSVATGLKALGEEKNYTFDPATGRIIPKPKPTGGFIPDWIPFLGQF